MTTEQKHTIEIQGLPEGWLVKEIKLWDALYEITPGSYNYDPCINTAGFKCELIVEKIKPRRIVLEETEEDNYSSSSVGPLSSGSQLNVQSLGDGLLLFGAPKIWRVINTFSEEE